MEYYSQFGQDKYCNDNFFRNKRDGIFVDIGASDGKTMSNTLFFEKNLNWCGLCVEPRENVYEKLKKNRKCYIENVAVSDIKSESASFLEIEGYGGGLSGLISKYDPKHIQRIKEEIKNPNFISKKTIKVKTVLLPELLEKYSLTKIDFLSIDTEGGELDIIKTLDLKKYQIDVIDIENNYHDNSINEYLKRYGYELKTRIICDEIYKKLD